MPIVIMQSARPQLPPIEERSMISSAVSVSSGETLGERFLAGQRSVDSESVE